MEGESLLFEKTGYDRLYIPDFFPGVLYSTDKSLAFYTILCHKTACSFFIDKGM